MTSVRITILEMPKGNIKFFTNVKSNRFSTKKERAKAARITKQFDSREANYGA